MSAPQVSAIICTHNRDQYLGAAIDSLLAQTFPNFEIIVVDNACTDRTAEIVQTKLTDARLRYVYEPLPGLSVARNTGAQAAQGEILAYLDDDAVATPHWLDRIAAAYQGNPQLAIAGGKVTLLWADGITAPAWLSAGLASNLGAYDLGETLVYVEQPQLTPRGLNYSIRKTFLEQIGGFDPNLGRVGKNLLSNEELHMTTLALHQGWQVAYLPDALVAHNVAPERVHRQWFLNRGWWQGISECYREQIAGEAGLGQFQRGGERFIRGLYKAAKFVSNPAICFENLVYSYGQIGYLSKALQGLWSAKAKRS
jgi:glycosyltransferase involved in cell wall biosynthesis